MIRFLSVWWPAILVLAMVAAFYFYGENKKDEGAVDAKKDAKIETLETDNQTKDEAIQIRTKQNEIRNNRLDTDALVDSLRGGTF